MAYMSQENKKAIAPQIKKILKKYDMKGSISVRHHSELVVTLSTGALDIAGENVNMYWLGDHYTGATLNFFEELKAAMNGEGSGAEQNFDKSDVQTDYFYVGWYTNIKVGKWDKPYICTETV